MQSAASALPPKEAKEFRTLFKFYDQKQYSKGIKHADKVLEKFPNHAETLSLKGLFLFFTGDKDKGFEMTKGAVTKNLKSELCWHILGVLYRQQKNYDQAIKSYKQSLKYDPENQNVQRDLAVLQIHCREFADYAKSRYDIVKTKSGVPANWIGVAVAEYLLGKYEDALKYLTSAKKVAKEGEIKRYENSELHLFETQIMIDMKDYQRALNYMTEHKDIMVDKTSYNELLFTCYIKLGQLEKADECVDFLLNKYPDNLKIFDLLKERHNVVENKPENYAKYIEILDGLVTKQPNSKIFQREKLNYLEGEAFKTAFDTYIRPFFIKGLPSAYSDIKSLLSDKSKLAIVEKLFLDHHESLTKGNNFAGSQEVENPCCLLWCSMLLAELYDFKKDYNTALKYIEEAIDHTPTLVELYMIKAKIYKHNRNYKLASEIADKARLMDLADRYPNNLTAKYRIRNNEIPVAEELIKSFMKDTNDENLVELQYSWYEYECAQSYIRQNQIGPALRRYQFIQQHFDGFIEDQFDFHTYVLRKYQMRAYLKMLRNADNIYDSIWYVKATIGAIEGYESYENMIPEIQKKEEEEQKLMDSMNSKERRQYKKKKEDKEKESDPVREKIDFNGKKLLAELKDPVAEANQFAKNLLKVQISDVKWRKRGFSALVRFYVKKDKLILAIKAYNKISEFANSDAEVHTARMILILALDKACHSDQTNSEIKNVLNEALEDIRGQVNAATVHSNFCTPNQGTSLLNRIRCYIVEATILNNTDASKVITQVIDFCKEFKDKCNVKEALFAYDLLSQQFNAAPEKLQPLKDLFKEKFNLCPIFDPAALDIKPIVEKVVTSLVE